jgi:hypothetical protein
MTGFKDGAASGDPFGGGDDGDSDETSTDSDEPDAAGGGSQSLDAPERENEDETATSDGLPWIYQRNSIKDGREKTVQLHLQSSTLDDQREAKADAEQRLGESVKKADLREAALLVGLEHVDEVVTTLRQWGYDVES